MIDPNRSNSNERTPKPNGGLLVLIAGCLAVILPFASLHLKFREFYLDSRVPRYQIPMNAVFFAFLVLPVILLILFVIRRKNLSCSWRSTLVLSPILLLTLPGLIEGIFLPAKPRDDFAERMGLTIPKDAIVFKAWFSHAPGESSYMFTFRCSAVSTEALLAVNGYKLIEDPSMLDPDAGEFYQLPIAGRTPPNGWPTPRTWDGLKVYSSDVPGGYRYLLTDGGRSQVFILVGDT